MRQRRRLLTAALFALLLGAATPLAIAWAIAEWRPLPDEVPMAGGTFMHWDDPWPWSTVERHSIGATVIGWARVTGDYVTARPEGRAAQIMHQLRVAQMTPEEVMERLQESRERLLRERPAFNQHDQPPRWGTFARKEPPPQGQRTGSDTSFGWPLRCLWYQVQATYGLNRVWGEELHGGILRTGRPSAVTRQFRALPLMPIWTGLAGNTLFYGVIWFALLLAPRALVRAVRRRRGLCAECGYDLSGSVMIGCPECGEGRAASP